MNAIWKGLWREDLGFYKTVGAEGTVADANKSESGSIDAIFVMVEARTLLGVR